MSVRLHGCHGDVPGRFNEDAPRPPVPGEEDSDVSSLHLPYPSRPGGPSATPRRSDLDLGFEPEGSASPAPPHLRWAESLHFLLDDRDGTALFRAFLLQEGCADLLDFWFACSGFRKLPKAGAQDGRRLKLAKAIYRKYIADSGSGGVVSRKIKPATKSFIRECVCRAQLDSALFEQAQVEVQALMEEHTYPLFLKSDVYLAFAQRSGADENSPKLSTSPGNQETTLPGYLPTLMEDKEWAETTEPGHAHSGRLTQKLLIETATQRITANQKRPDHWEARVGVRELVNPYYVNSGIARAPVTSANDSELQSLSSDADTISLTDSSVEGIPPYRFRKQQRRHMQESVKANGLVPLPHIPRTHRLPKDIHVEPQKFAAELISRLELIQRERENQRKLEEKLQRVRMEEECEDADVSTVTSLPGPCLRFHGSGMGQWSDDAQAILDEHLQRVMKSPGCQSPKNPSHAHADFNRYGSGGRCYSDGMNLTANQSETSGYGSRVNSLSRRSLRGTSDSGRGPDGRGLEVPEEAEQKQKILQWMMDGERESGRYRKSSSSGRPGWVSGSDRYDAGAGQSEEGRRRSAAQHSKQRLKSSCGRKSVSENITVAYYFCGEPIPYRTSVKGRVVTLGQFKELLTKKGSYRFYFKKVSDEFDCGVVYEEVHEDDAVLPIFEDRIVGKVEKID